MRRSSYRAKSLSGFVAVAIFTLFASFIFLSFSLNNVIASGEGQKGVAPEAPGHEEVPFDVPVEEIKKYLAPPNKLTIFPCSDCHDKSWETNSQRRDLIEPHDVTPGKFINHDSENRWCLDCHSSNNRDKFRLLNGKLIDFKEYYKVCEQCHKRVYREWKMGVHGKRTGFWNGEKQYMHCSQCHNPHNPPFKALEPMPPPRKPKEVRILSEK